MKKGNNRTIPGTWILLFFICFAFGVCAANIWKKEMIEESGFLNEYTLLCMSRVKLDYRNYFLYLLRKRAGGAFFLALLSSTYLGLAGIYSYICQIGLASGIFLAGAGIRYGAKGILLFLGGMIPHQLLLIPCGIMFLCWCYRMCTTLYYPGRCTEPLFGSKKQFIIRKVIQFQMILGVVITGCLLECYVNPYIITKLLKFF